MFEEMSGAFMALIFRFKGVGECKRVHLFVFKGVGGVWIANV